LNAGAWVAIYMPIFILLFLILPQQRAVHKVVQMQIRKRKGVAEMTNELVKNYIGKNCYINAGSFGPNVKGIIIDVNENWLEIETKKGKELINGEFIQRIIVMNK